MTSNAFYISGYHSAILEAELINDGGYKYATFDIVNPQDMIVENYKNVSETVKKIIEIIPNFTQVEFNDSAVDYSDLAINQHNNLQIGTAEDLIWNKTFKIRLTSKKTGKKIDLNITYNNPNIYLGE